MTDFSFVLSAVADVLYAFLSIKDVVGLDKACLNKNWRLIYRETLARADLSELEFSSRSASWILARRLKPTYVWLDISVTVEYTQSLTSFSDRVRTVQLAGDHYPRPYLKKKITYLPAWMQDRSIRDADFIELTMSCVSLVELRISDQGFDIEAFRAILQKCVKIRHIDLYNCTQLMSNRALEAIVELCPSATDLSFANAACAPREEFRSLAVACKNLKRLHLRTAHGGFLPGLRVYAENSPSTLEVLSLWNTSVWGPELPHFTQRCLNLKRLHLLNCGTDSGAASAYMVTMLTHARSLETLYVNQCKWFNSECFGAVRHCAPLRVLYCSEIGEVPTETLVTVISSLRELESLDLRWAFQGAQTRELIRPLSEHCPKLKSLHLRDDSVVQADLDRLTSRCTQLTTLVLSFKRSSFSLNAAQLHCLTTLNLDTRGTIPEWNLVRILFCCPSLLELSFMSAQTVLQSEQIVTTIALNCPRLERFDIFFCSESLLQQLLQLQAKRKSEGRKFACTVSEVVPSTVTDHVLHRVRTWISAHIL